MEEVRQLVQEEGREARNLVAFHVAVDTPTPSRVARKPPRAGAGPLPPRRAAPRAAARLRSASAGRDKRSELRARYWALLFGDLQRAIGEIYNTVESHENLNECQEVILVLENYTRDFKALGEWFRLKWEYDNTPPPQRPQSLAWEIRKTDFVRPESRRTHSVKSSPSVSGKNSPCLSGHNTPSGKNSPNLTGKASPGSGKISPRISHSNTSPKGSIEFFSSKIASKIATKPEPKVGKDPRLSDIKEKELKEDANQVTDKDKQVKDEITTIKPIIEVGKAKEIPPNAVPKPVVIKSAKLITVNDEDKKLNTELSSQAKTTIAKLDAMENEFLASHLTEVAAANDNLLNKDIEIDKPDHDSSKSQEELPNTVESVDQESHNESPAKSEDNFGDISNASSKSSDDKSIEVDKSDEMVDIDLINKPDTVTLSTQVNGVNNKIDDGKSNPKDTENNIEKNKKSLSVADTKDITQSKYSKQNKKDVKPEVAKNNVTQKDVKKSEPSKDLKKDKEKDQPVKENKSEVIKNTDVKEIKNSEPIKDLKNNSPSSKEPSSNGNGHVDNENKSSPAKDTKHENNIKKSDSKSQIDADADKETKKDDTKKAETKINTETKSVSKAAYSQAAAKPKPPTPKTEIKIPTKTTLVRSKTVVEIRPSSAPKSRQFLNRGPKCSYPFNLTTGRTSLFDAPGNKSNNVNKKLMHKPQMASGDSKIQTKDIRTRPPRPSSLKINEKGDELEKMSTSFEKIKDIDEYNSSESVVTQLDMSRIESSESLKTLVPDNGDVANSIEVLNIDGSKNDNEGWLTVKSRRLSRESKKSKSHWANRFHQPSATTSLPTLNMIESPKSETKTIVNLVDRAQSEQPQNKPPDETVKKPEALETQNKLSEKPIKKSDVKETKEKPQEKISQATQENSLKDKQQEVITMPLKTKTEKLRDTSMIRQKSDVTGLKTRSSRSKAIKKEKSKDKRDCELTKNRLHSSLESLTTGLARSQESTVDTFDFDKWKAEFKTTFKYFEDDDQICNHNEILKTADPFEMVEIAEMTSQIEENERKISLALDFQSEADQRKLSEEEDLLNRQIMELQQVSDIEIDTETDDTETDAEILLEDTSRTPTCQSTESLSMASLEDQYETALAGMSWAERVDTLGALEALVARDPGRAQELHAKLSLGLRRRGSLQDALRRLQAKQARADTQRETLATQRRQRIHALLARVEEVKMAKNQLIEEKRIRMERRLQKAAENRDQHLKDIVRKAHDEEEKLREIAFIKQLEAENRRHEFLDQCRSHTTRLREMRQERFDKLAAAAAREAAVGARRAALEAARSLRVATLLARRQLQHDRQQSELRLKVVARKHAARERATRVRARLSALSAAAARGQEVLRARIHDKQQATSHRRLTHIHHRAARPPRHTTTSESQEPFNEEEEEANRLEQERRERERQKAIRKKARKIKQKLLDTSKDIPVDVTIKPIHPSALKMHKVIYQISNIITPLLSTENVTQNGLDFDEEKKKKGKKKDKDINITENNNTETQKDKDSNNKKDIKKSDENTKQKNKKDTENNNVEEVEGVKKKKKKKNDGQKLSKSNSICSSMSDMSKSSVKIERNVAVIDMPSLEKLLNELHRLLSQEYRFPEYLVATKLFAIRTLGQIISLAAEREDLAHQFTTKCITTCIVCVSRAVCACGSAFLYSAACAHTALLLAGLLEKDLQSEPREMELARHMTDCLSVVLDSVLCSSRLKEDSDQLAEKRARVHTTISYLCLSGCISRAEKAGEVRESIQTLLTVCADLCHPCDADVGPELASATQSLRCALGTSLCGSRSEFCMLFATGAELGRSGSFVRAARTAHLLRALAEMDHQIVQEAFGEGGWPLEFRAAVARLLSQHAPNDKEAPRTTVLRLSNQRLDQTLSETMVLDLIVLVGFMVVNNPVLHDTICENWSVIKALCMLPANWLVSGSHCHALLPTLVVLAERPATADIIAGELSMKMLEEYVNSSEAQKVKLIQVLKQGKDKTKKGKCKPQDNVD